MDKAPPTSLVALRDTRERTIATLSDAFARDDLDMDEFERRLGIAHRSESPEEISALTSDLPGQALAAPTAAPTALAPSPATAPAHLRDQQTLVAILGGTTREGSWTPARSLKVVTMLGGAQLDFREARLVPGVTELHVTAVLGGVQIIVPPQLAVEMDGIAIMGGFAHTDRTPVQPDPDRPILRVTGLAFWGGVNIETRLPGEDERAAHRRRREQRRLDRRDRRDRRDRPALPARGSE